MPEVESDFDSWRFGRLQSAVSGGTDEWCSKLEFVVIVLDPGRGIGFSGVFPYLNRSKLKSLGNRKGNPTKKSL